LAPKLHLTFADKGRGVLGEAICNTSTGTMSYDQFTQYDVELEVPEEAVQYLDENVRKSMGPPLSLVELSPANAA
jgi:hypothetical protein